MERAVGVTVSSKKVSNFFRLHGETSKKREKDIDKSLPATLGIVNLL
jgi:hypothetical protein